ncbi:MAG: efflux RND transporter permease subunit [Firmicutes bacterium]|jgi:multidrug efflux pump subunit AcrB|nr:efflux RND transporter permease subunit [Bacillota bacterium]
MEKLLKSMMNNRAITVFLIVIISLSGVLGYYFLPRQENPDVSVPVAMIITPFPGASAKDVEELVLTKIEDELNKLDDVDEITGTAKSGLGITIIMFDLEAENDKSMQDVRNAIADAKTNMPSGVMDSIIDTDLISTSGILISLSGENYSYSQLVSFGEQFKDKLTEIDGISKFEIEGEIDKEIKVDIDIDKLNSLGLSLEDVYNVLRMQNVEIPSGYIESGKTRINVEAVGTFDSLEDIKNTVLSVSPETGISLRLKDIADVRFDLEDDSEKYKQNGNNAVILSGYFEKGKNVVIVGSDVRKELDSIKSSLPEDLIVEEIIYQPDDVAKSVNDFMMNLIVGIALVILVVFLGMGARNSVVVSTALPLSILITFTVMYLSKIYIHQMSLTALIVALGVLVDNAIVISDGIQVNIDNGMDNTTGAISAVKKASIPVFTATLTTVAAFSPLMGMPGGAGKFLMAIPLVLIISVIASYLVAMFVIPFFGQWLFRPTKKKSDKQGFIRKWFNHMLDVSMKHRVKVVVGVVVIFVLVIKLVVPQLPSQFFPYVEKDLLYLKVSNDVQGDINSTDDLTNQITEILSDEESITSITTGVGDGLPKFYISMMTSAPSADYAQMLIKYDFSKDERFESREEFGNYLQTKLDNNVVGGEAKVNLLQNGAPIDAKIILRVSGENYDNLVEVAQNIEKEMEAIEGVTNIRDDIIPEVLQYSIDIDTESATMMGITNYDVQRQVNMALYGSTPTVYIKDGEEYNVKLSSNISDKSDLENYYIKSSMTKNKIPLRQYADVTFSSKVDTINRYNGKTSVTILADALPKFDSASLEGRIETEILPNIEKLDTNIVFDGERESIAEMFGVLGILAVFSIALIYVILVVQFKSFLQPVVILTTIPLSLIGSMLGLFILNQPLSLTAFLGIIALVGLVVKNGILLIEYINEARENGMDVKEACEDAVDKRFNAIILSALTTIMGLFPLAISGNSLFAPMAISLMAGLMVSTVLTMVIVPVIYSLISRVK